MSRATLRCAHHRAARVANGRDRQRHVDAAAILRDAHRLVVVDALSAPLPRKDVGLLASKLRRNQSTDRRPNHLGRRVAEDPFGAGIPGLDDAVQVLADDGVVRRLDQRSQALLNQLELRQAG